MSFLVFVLYLAELAGSARVLFGFGIAIFSVLGFTAFLNYFMNEYDDEGRKNLAKFLDRIKTPFFVCVFLFVIVPSQVYFYTVAGAISLVKDTSIFFETTEGKKIKDLINLKLDEALEKTSKINKPDK